MHLDQVREALKHQQQIALEVCVRQRLIVGVRSSAISSNEACGNSERAVSDMHTGIQALMLDVLAWNCSSNRTMFSGAEARYVDKAGILLLAFWRIFFFWGSWIEARSCSMRLLYSSASPELAAGAAGAGAGAGAGAAGAGAGVGAETGAGTLELANGPAWVPENEAAVGGTPWCVLPKSCCGGAAGEPPKAATPPYDGDGADASGRNTVYGCCSAVAGCGWYGWYGCCCGCAWEKAAGDEWSVVVVVAGAVSAPNRALSFNE